MQANGNWVLHQKDNYHEGLIIGNLTFVNKPSNLLKNNVKAVLSILRIRTPSHKIHLQSSITHHKLIEIDDQSDVNILRYFQTCYDFIERHLPKGNVVVHCQMGISRSATVIIAYLMKRFKWSYGMARDYLRECRPSIYPNSGFVRQLKEWGREIGVKCLKRRRRE